MESLREELKKVTKQKPGIAKDELVNLIMSKMQKEEFLTAEELETMKDELMERLSNY